MSGHKNSGMLGNIALWGISGLVFVFFVIT